MSCVLLEQIDVEKCILNVYGTDVLAVNSAKTLRLRPRDGRMREQTPGHFSFEMLQVRCWRGAGPLR